MGGAAYTEASQDINSLRGLIYGTSVARENPVTLTLYIPTWFAVKRFILMSLEHIGAYRASREMYKVDIYFTHVTLKNVIISKIFISILEGMQGAEAQIEISDSDAIEWVGATKELPIERAYRENGLIYGKEQWHNWYTLEQHAYQPPKGFFDITMPPEPEKPPKPLYAGAIHDLPGCAITSLQMQFPERLNITGIGDLKTIDIYPPEPPTISMGVSVLGNSYQFDTEVKRQPYDNIENTLSQIKSVQDTLSSAIRKKSYMIIDIDFLGKITFLIERFDCSQKQLMQGEMTITGHLLSVLGSQLDNWINAEVTELTLANIARAQEGSDITGDTPAIQEDNTPEQDEAARVDTTYDCKTTPILAGEEEKYWLHHLNERITYLMKIINKKNGLVDWFDPEYGEELRRITNYRDRRQKK